MRVDLLRPPGKVVSLLAGGLSATPLEQEAAEDDRGGGAADLAALEVGRDDIVVGVSASGRTGYVGAIETAMRAGAATACVVSAPESQLEALVDHPVVVVVRPGSGRLDPPEGGNGAEARSQHALDDLHDPPRQDVRQPDGRRRGDERQAARASPAHRRDRHRSPAGQVAEALAAADGDAKVAIVSLLGGVDVGGRARLDAAGHNIRLALES